MEVDSWRLMNNKVKDFSFFSHPHNSYSCLYYILIDQQISDNISSAIIAPSAWSDPSTIITKLRGLTTKNKTRSWSLNESLSNPQNLQQMEEELIEKFKINNTRTFHLLPFGRPISQ
ncbi:hypothetical protein FKM82_003508 [Ascaphus truei]